MQAELSDPSQVSFTVMAFDGKVQPVASTNLQLERVIRRHRGVILSRRDGATVRMQFEPLGGFVPFVESIWAAAQTLWNSVMREDAADPADMLREDAADPADALLREADHIEVAIRVLMGRGVNEKARIFLIEAERRRAMARRIVRCVDGR